MATASTQAGQLPAAASVTLLGRARLRRPPLDHGQRLGEVEQTLADSSRSLDT